MENPVETVTEVTRSLPKGRIGIGALAAIVATYFSAKAIQSRRTRRLVTAELAAQQANPDKG